MTDLAPLTPPDSFVRGAESLGIRFDAGDLDRLGLYLALLLDANTRFNLTAIRDPDEAWNRHILDSLTLVPYIASVGTRAGGTGVAPVRVADVGSGGGLPGIPLAIALPDVQFTLIEATGKKARFLDEVVAKLSLPNARVINERVETLGSDPGGTHREQYDIVIARAVGRLPVLLELAVPLAKVGGHVLAMKGAKAQEEITKARAGPGGGALHLLHAHIIDARPTPTGVIIIIEKQRKTPRKYPRKPGEPSRAPLG
jgi:16S rRNA (guanine527-N7)-methyltransferase